MPGPAKGTPNEYYDPEDPFGNNKSGLDPAGYQTYDEDVQDAGYEQVSAYPEPTPEQLASGGAPGQAGAPGSVEGMFGFDPIELEYGSGKDINPYGAGSIDMLTPMLISGTDPGASAYEGLTSSYSELGPSAFTDLSLDPTARGDIVRAQQYFGDLMSSGGRDAVSEAEFQRRASQAEQRRRAATEAAMREAEARGMAGQGVLAAFANAQGATNDMHQAGLDAAAIAQARRDAAARQFGGASERLAGLELGADTAQAQGLDSFGLTQAGGEDSFGLGKASGQDAMAQFKAGEQNKLSEAYAQREYDKDKTWFDRSNVTRDKNTELQNATSTFNKVTSPQQLFQNQLSVTQGATGGSDPGGYGANAAGQDKESEGAFGLLSKAFTGFF